MKYTNKIWVPVLMMRRAILIRSEQIENELCNPDFKLLKKELRDQKQSVEAKVKAITFPTSRSVSKWSGLGTGAMHLTIGEDMLSNIIYGMYNSIRV